MTRHRLRDSLLYSTKLETRKREVANLTHREKMNLDIIKMGKLLGSPPKNGFVVYNPLPQTKVDGGVLLGRSFIYYLKSYCIKKTGACLRSHDSHFWILVGECF